jgi:hypothetical protein
LQDLLKWGKLSLSFHELLKIGSHDGLKEQGIWFYEIVDRTVATDLLLPRKAKKLGPMM